MQERHIDHAVVNTEAIPEWPSLFVQVEAAIPVYEPSAIDIACITETRVIIEFHRRIDAIGKRHIIRICGKSTDSFESRVGELIPIAIGDS